MKAFDLVRKAGIKKMTAALAALVVLCTAYVLTTPAISVTQDAARPEAGFYVDGQQADAASTDTAPADAAAPADAKADATAPDNTGTAGNTSTPDASAPDVPAYPKQDLRQKADLGDGLVLEVRVEAGEGTLPEGTVIKLDAIPRPETIDLMKAEAADKANMPADATGVIATDISFVGPDGSAVEPRGKVVVSLTCPVIAPDTQAAIAHVKYAKHPEDPDGPDGRDRADIVELRDLDGRDTVERSVEQHTVYFEATDFSPYGIVYLLPADGEPVAADPDAPDAGAATVAPPAGTDDGTQSDGAPAPDGTQPDAQPADAPAAMPAQSFTADIEAADGSAVTVTVEADEGAFPEGATMSITPVEDAAVIDAARAEAADKTPMENNDSMKALGFDIAFADADGNAIEPAKPVHVSMATQAIADRDQLAVVRVDGDGHAEILPADDATADQGSVAFDVADSSVYAMVYTTADSLAPMPAQSFTADVEAADGSTITVTVDADEGAFPEGVTMIAASVEDSAVIDAARAEAADKTPMDDNKAMRALAVDITFADADGNAIEPAKPVRVSMRTQAIAEQNELAVVHVDDDKQAEVVPTGEVAADQGSVAFDAASFSVYALVYTVDFHWEVNGKIYEFSLPGGGFVSLEQLVEVLGINGDDVQGEDEEKSGVNDADNAGDDGNVVLMLSDIQISEETKKFVADVENVEFSSPKLIWVGKVDSDSTVGRLKEANGLDVQYSAELTEEQIEDINAQTVESGDWALISLQPFTSEETLTVTMKNGDVFEIKVTDAQDPSVYVGKEVIIYDNGEQRAMTSTNNTWDGYRYRFPSIPLSEADGNESAHWTIERNNNNYYLKSSDGKYLTIDGNNVGLVDNWSVATPLGIQAGSNPDYRIYAANNYNSVLTYDPNGNNDGYFSAPGGTYTNPGDEHRWLYIREVETVPDRAGDWILYFDDDFDEITIHVGETISLRPYNKWEWKEGNVDVQTAHWNIGGKDNSYWNQISVNDDNGARQQSWDDGGTGGTAGFHWTAYVKKDDQLTTHYWAVQGQATKTGDYVLTNTKNGKTITVHVVDGDPVNKPGIINNIANIKVNLFDYDNGGRLDVGLVDDRTNQNLANNNNFKNESVNQMGGSDHFYFLSSGSGNNNNESWNSYTKDSANPGIVQNALNSAGYPVLNHGNHTSLQYLFDTSQASQSWHGGSGGNGMIAYPDVVGMFQKDSAGYYYFNSNTNYFYYDTATGTSKLYEHTYTQNSSASKGSLANDKPIGFFPFHDYDSTNDLYVNQNAALNHHVGMSMEVEFMLPNNRLDDNNQPIIFDFSGDDDLWVFVEWEDDNGQKQSKLLLDLGGVHQPIHGAINFTNGSNTAFMETNRPYTLKVFYLERGGCDSNCSIRFNLPIIQDLNVAKKLTGLTEAEKAKYSNEEFEYEVLVNGEPYNYPNPNNRYEKAIIRNAAGKDVTPTNFKIENGRFKLKDGQTLTITYLDRSDTFSVAEIKTSNMENFEVPNAERYYHQAHDASLYEEEIHLTASQTQSEPRTDCWTTPRDHAYELEDTEKVTFTNTLKEKNLEVEKKWVGEQTHPDSITFKVIATVEDAIGVRQPYAVAALKESDGTTDKTFTLNDANKWRLEIEHLPVNTPDGKFIFYDIVEDYVDGYVLTGSRDLTAEEYNYCNVDVVKLWPDSNGTHTEVLKVILKNSEGKYYAGVDTDGKAIFTEDRELASVYELKPDNNYTHRFARLPYGDYTAEQLHEDEYNRGLATYRRAIIQYELENTPLEAQAGPSPKAVTPDIHKRIDALRDGVTNPDSAHENEDLTDLYRLYLDYKIDALQDPNGVDLLFVIDHSGSMNSSDWPGNEYRAQSVASALNGNNGLISKFLDANEKNRWAAVGFKGPKSSDYTWSLSNPWEPKTEAAHTNAGQNGSEVLSSGSTFNRNAANIDIDNEGASVLSNYTAGFWRAEQFLLDSDVKADGRKKVVVFITDGVPTLHISGLNNSLQNAGEAAGSPYYREEYGGCPDEALTEFRYFVHDMTGNGYSFGGENGNVDFYTIGLGASMQTAGGNALLNNMLEAAYGQGNVPSSHYMTIADAANNADNSAANALSKDLRIILGLNDTFSNLVIQDDLSQYVNLYGLSADSEVSNIMRAAKAKVTMSVPNAEHPENPPQVITLYENGAPVTDNENAKFTKADGTNKATIIQKLEYDATSKTVTAVFDPEYQPAGDVTYTLSFDVKATDTAYTTYAASGYDKYVSGDKQGQVIVGDEDTDFLGTDPDNATSVNKAGFRSNDEAKATYHHNDENESKVYPHPVIQVAAKVDIVKVDQSGNALEGAKFNLYDDKYDASKTIEENASHLIEADLQSKKPTDPAGSDAVIRSGKLAAGTYYLVETEAPGGYNSISGPVKITVAESDGILQMTAEIAGESVGDKKLVRTGNGVWKLSVQNSAGYELPHTGGPGTHLFTLFGAMLTLLAGVGLIVMRRQRRDAA